MVMGRRRSRRRRRQTDLKLNPHRQGMVTQIASPLALLPLQKEELQMMNEKEQAEQPSGVG
jgi:hypothetical protein